MFETMSQQQPQSKPERKLPSAEELFGSNVFEVEKAGKLKRVSKDIEKPITKEEIPESIREEAKKYAEEKAWFARTPKEANEIKEESIKEFYKLKAKEIERIKKLEEKKKMAEGEKEEIIELTEEVK